MTTNELKRAPTNRYMLVAILLASMGVTAFLLYSLLQSQAQTTSAPAAPAEYTGTVIDPPRQLEDFALPANNGDIMRLSDLRGEWVLMFFGYLHCPDYCPLTLAEFNRIKGMLGDDANQVQFVFISVDGVRDTPDSINEYLSRFDPEFIGLSGDDETLTRIEADYDLFYERRVGTSEDEYPVDHTTLTYLIDPQGKLRMTYFYGTEPSVVADSIQQQVHAS